MGSVRGDEGSSTNRDIAAYMLPLSPTLNKSTTKRTGNSYTNEADAIMVRKSTSKVTGIRGFNEQKVLQNYALIKSHENKLKNMVEDDRIVDMLAAPIEVSEKLNSDDIPIDYAPLVPSDKTAVFMPDFESGRQKLLSNGSNRRKPRGSSRMMSKTLYKVN